MRPGFTLHSSSGGRILERSDLRRAILRNYPATIAFFRARLAGRRTENVEDLAQDTMVAALGALSDPGSVEIQDPASYVLGIARRKLADLIRDDYRRPTVPLLVRSDETIKAMILAASAEHRLVEREDVVRLAAAMQDLHPQDRQVLRLRYIDGLGNAEVAARVGLSPDETSRVRYRALEKLRKLLGKGRP